MGIEPPYIGLYGVWSMVGIEVRGMAEAGCYWGVVWVGQWRFRVFRIRTATLSCARILRDSPRRTVLDDCSYIEPRSLYGCYCEDIVCLTIRYHETDGSDAVTDSKTSLKTSPPRHGYLVASTPGNSVQK